MSFLLQEQNATFVNVKLTDTGRRLLSLGQLTYKKAVLSDREIDYNFDRSRPHNILLSRIMSPKDDHPKLPPLNFDGTSPIDLQGHLFGGVFSFSSDCFSRGFYSGSTSVTGQTIPTAHDYSLDSDLYLGSNEVISDFLDGTNVTELSSQYDQGYGNLAFILYNNPSNNSSAAMNTNAPFVGLWYRVTGDTTSMTADRPFPDFSTSVTMVKSPVYYYPWNGISSYYGSANTVDVQVWNMNIVRTSSEIGTVEGASGYTTYGSREYNGQKHYFGFDNSHRQIGFIHYSNAYTGSSYSEQFIPGSVEVDIPHLLWHRHECLPGEGELSGHRFTDKGSSLYYDYSAQTPFTLLKDGTSTDSVVVGRVYPELKMIAITDPELLTALSYKSNRNWTLPPLTVSRRATPSQGLTIYDVAGCLHGGKTYYVTYAAYNDLFPYWDSVNSFGYRPFLHCGYIQKISGYTDSDGYSSYLSATFPQYSFPFLRSDVGMTTYSGTGWNADRMAIMIKEVDNDSDPGLDRIGSDGWKVINTSGGGLYVGGEDGAQTLNPSYTVQHEFIVDQGGVDNAIPYVLHPELTQRIDFRASGSTIDMTFGNEAFFFGNIKASTKRTSYKTVISLQADTEQLNTSINPTFDPNVDTATYLTEVGILDDQNRLVAVGKLTKPIKKDDTEYMTIQLEMDF